MPRSVARPCRGPFDLLGPSDMCRCRRQHLATNCRNLPALHLHLKPIKRHARPGEGANIKRDGLQGIITFLAVCVVCLAFSPGICNCGNWLSAPLGGRRCISKPRTPHSSSPSRRSGDRWFSRKPETRNCQSFSTDTFNGYFGRCRNDSQS